jgi:peroxiredoxin
LHDQIATLLARMAASAPPEVIATLGTELEKLATSGIADGALRIGATAPDFTLPDAHGSRVGLAALLERGPVVLTFYRGGWCPFRNLQLRSYQGVIDAIRACGAELVGISQQTPDYSLSDVEQKALTFPVLSDAGNAVARQYGLVYRLSEPLQALQTAFGNPIPKFNGDSSWELPVPATFVLDRPGTVVLAHVDPNYTVRLEPAAILEALGRLA